MFNVSALLSVFPKAMEGWLQVFVVTAVIIAVTYALNRFSSKKN